MHEFKEPMLKVEGLSFAYKSQRQGHVPVLEGLSIDVPAGSFVSILGPSGCGKSTLFSILTGRQKAKSGSFIITSPAAYMPQKDLLLPWRTVLGNAVLPQALAGSDMSQARHEALKLIPAFGLSGFENFLPQDLSGGMKQRVALLRTAMQKRRFLLLDEPLGALDALTRRQMQKWLLEIKCELGLTMLMTTHDIEEACYLSDIVYVLSARPARAVLRVEPETEGRAKARILIEKSMGLSD